MTSRAEIEMLIRETWTARRADDLAGTMACFHPEAAYHFVACPDFGPMSRPASGPELGQTMEQLIGDWDLSGLAIERISIDGDTAYVHHRGKAVNKKTKNAMDAEVLDVITVRDGKTVNYVQFTDTYLVAKTAGMI